MNHVNVLLSYTRLFMFYRPVHTFYYTKLVLVLKFYVGYHAVFFNFTRLYLSVSVVEIERGPDGFKFATRPWGMQNI